MRGRHVAAPAGGGDAPAPAQRPDSGPPATTTADGVAGRQLPPPALGDEAGALIERLSAVLHGGPGPEDAPVPDGGSVPAGGAVPSGDTMPTAAPASPVVLSDRPDGTVVRLGWLVCKVHAADGDSVELAARLRIAAHPELRGVLLAPLPLGAAADGVPTPPPPGRAAPQGWHPDDGGQRPAGSAGAPLAGSTGAPERPGAQAASPGHGPRPTPDLLAPVHGGRLASLWPYGRPVSPADREAVPWEALAELLARLHQVPVAALPGPVPAMRGPAKVAGALDRLRAAPRAVAHSPAARAVADAALLLPAWARGAAPPPPAERLCHGDLHLGQLVRCGAAGGAPGAASTAGWRLIDVDDLGLGDPAWDLARPAAWFATGLLDAQEWTRLLTAYRAAGGPAAGPDGDPWPWLDGPARALTVQSAALGLAKAAAGRRALAADEEAMVAACARMVGLATAVDTGLPATATPA